MKSKKFRVSLMEAQALKDRPDANLLLIQPVKTSNPLCFDYEVIPFQSRLALESFNKKAGLKAVIATQVPLNCALYRHESDSDARENLYAGFVESTLSGVNP